MEAGLTLIMEPWVMAMLAHMRQAWVGITTLGALTVTTVCKDQTELTLPRTRPTRNHQEADRVRIVEDHFRFG